MDQPPVQPAGPADPAPVLALTGPGTLGAARGFLTAALTGPTAPGDDDPDDAGPADRGGRPWVIVPASTLARLLDGVHADTAAARGLTVTAVTARPRPSYAG